ncbi:hypothetical protein QAD02_023021 [Eretmocerus hayati]|uniref:Uncharacterized protein n=1 Tax=Eretmocerus hayati TaxID=131215 RepID=A0ACC2PV02_9HYME|nr:hypothetical protein QAD02_023021 [Eretmocerus hayati]
MDFTEVFAIPKRPRLEFGVSLDEAYENGKLHPGLKDLFLKAYLNVNQDLPNNDENNECRSTSTPRVEPRAVLALQSGPEGQGSLSQRMQLKSKLELGEWLIPVQTPMGAPLWLLRHFLGRLPRPLLKGTKWRTASRACVTSILSSPDVGRVVQRLTEMVRSLSHAEFEVTGLLALLLRKLSTRWDRNRSEEVHNEETLSALTQYFISSITTRPFRPGLCTSADRELQPILMFLSRYWRIIFQGPRKSNGITSPLMRSLAIRHCESAPEIRRETTLADIDELHHFCDRFTGQTRNGLSNLGKELEEDVESNRRANFIGFEPLLFTHGRKDSNGDCNSFWAREQTILEDPTTGNRNPATNREDDMRKFRIELFLEDSILDATTIPVEDLNDIIEIEGSNTQGQIWKPCAEECLIYSATRSLAEQENTEEAGRIEEFSDQHSTLKINSLDRLFSSKSLGKNAGNHTSNNLMNLENIVPSEYEYFSVQDSEA